MAVTPFVFEPDWKSGIETKYKFVTVLNRSRRFKEQRRALFHRLLRHLKIEVWYETPEHQWFVNKIRAMSRQLLAVPIYKEQIFPAEDLQGETVINLATNTASLWNTRELADQVIIFSLTDFMKAEHQALAGVTDTTMTFGSAVSGAFTQNDTVIYPAFTGILVNKSFQVDNDQVIKANLEFREVLETTP